jgi:two-component system chemotaxis response regulator CheY
MAYNILVVDDSATARSIMKKLIELSGIDSGSIFEAGNGEAALSVLKQQWIDIVLSDVKMPVMDGIGLLKAMKNDEVLGMIPVIMTSAEGNAQVQNDSLAAGARAYLSKPFSPESLRLAVEKALA